MNKETIHIENLSIGYPGKGDVKVDVASPSLTINY